MTASEFVTMIEREQKHHLDRQPLSHGDYCMSVAYWMACGVMVGGIVGLVWMMTR